MELSRKHARSYEDLEIPQYRKRAKLDSLFGNLNLDDNDLVDESDELPSSISNNTININPHVHLYPRFGGVPDYFNNSSASSFNNYVALKVVSHFEDVIKLNMAVIRHYDYRIVVIFRLQRWLLRLFSKFLKKYCMTKNITYRPIHHYDKMMKLVAENGLEFSEFLSIVLEENRIEQNSLAWKLRHKRSSVEADQHDVKELGNISYNYWDTIKLNEDFQMLLSDSSGASEMDGPKIEELGDHDDHGSDIDMETDLNHHCDTLELPESNYGSYYQDYKMI